MVFGNVALERQAIELTYEGLCTVTEFRQVKNPETKETEQQEVVVLENQPCALSQTSLATTQQTESTNDISYDAKLFLSPEVSILAGSRFRVNQNGMNSEFEQSGEPFRYPTHQEIKLKRIDRA